MKNIPNILSALRLLLTFVLLHGLFKGNFHGIVFLFALGCATDFFDGYLARRFHWQTPLGKVLDPLADKLFIGGLFLVLDVRLGLFPPLLVTLIVGRDVVIMMAVAILWKLGRLKKITPSFMSKCNTALQMLLILMGLLFLEYDVFMDMSFLIILVGVTTVMSLWDYGKTAIGLIRG